MKADDLIGEIDAYIEWHNERRIKSSLGYMSPMEYRKSLGYELGSSKKTSAAPNGWSA